MRNSYKISVGKTEGNISSGRTRCRWWDIIKTDIK
jgi:hypothetical protein